MNFEPFRPFEPAEPLVPPVVTPSNAPSAAPFAASPEAPMAHYFDPAGLVWILACVLIATMAGRLLPKLAEPDGLRNTVAALGAMGVGAARPAEIASSTTVAGLPLQGPSPAQPTRARQAKQEVDPLVPAVLRQF